MRWSAGGVLGTLALLMLGTAAFACMSMLLAAGVKERERFMGIGQLIMMPLFFASSALYPLTIMPGWLHFVARVNPLTYEVQGLRQMLVGVGGGGEVWLDFLVVTGFFLKNGYAEQDACTASPILQPKPGTNVLDAP